MLTSESNNEEIHRFFRQNNPILAQRLLTLLNKKYRHSLVKIVQRGGEMPIIFGSYKIADDITLYGTPIDIKITKTGVEYTSMGPFLIMKDLRQQSRIMVTDNKPHAIIYNTHAISRFKERLGLDEDMDLVEVCKNMYLAGCTHPTLIVDSGEIYGTDLNSRTAKIICAEGAFLGHMSGETEVIYAETFLSPNELRDDQEYLDPNKNPYFKEKKLAWESQRKGKSYREESGYGSNKNRQISIEDGKNIKIMSEEEIKAQEERYLKKIEENPNFFEDQIEPNRQKAINRIKRKGYK